MLVATSCPSASFTLSSPSLEQPVAAAGVEHVWWRRWGAGTRTVGAGIAGLASPRLGVPQWSRPSLAGIGRWSHRHCTW
jgi:hypothetical protein